MWIFLELNELNLYEWIIKNSPIHAQPKCWIITVRPTKDDKSKTTMSMIMIKEGRKGNKSLLHPNHDLILFSTEPPPNLIHAFPPELTISKRKKAGSDEKMRQMGFLIDSGRRKTHNTEKDIVDERERERTRRCLPSWIFQKINLTYLFPSVQPL